MDYEIYPDPQHYPTLKYHYYHYRKHSDYEKLYLKDVNFTGSLYNENHKNIDENGYDPYQDNGGYFAESRYRFKGVSTQSGKFDFAGAVLQIGLGYIPLGTSGLSVGDVINVVTSINELVKFYNNAVRDFRGEISNEAQYKNDIFSGMLRNDQIGDFGEPIKYSATQFQTNNTKDAVLLGINNDNYARNERILAKLDPHTVYNDLDENTYCFAMCKKTYYRRIIAKGKHRGCSGRGIGVSRILNIIFCRYIFDLNTKTHPVPHNHDWDWFA